MIKKRQVIQTADLFRELICILAFRLKKDGFSGDTDRFPNAKGRPVFLDIGKSSCQTWRPSGQVLIERAEGGCCVTSYGLLLLLTTNHQCLTYFIRFEININ